MPWRMRPSSSSKGSLTKRDDGARTASSVPLQMLSCTSLMPLLLMIGCTPAAAVSSIEIALLAGPAPAVSP